MVDIDQDKLQNLMELVYKEHPDLDPYIIWTLSVNHLLNEPGIYGDENLAKQIREKRNEELKYNIKIV